MPKEFLCRVKSCVVQRLAGKQRDPNFKPAQCCDIWCPLSTHTPDLHPTPCGGDVKVPHDAVQDSKQIIGEALFTQKAIQPDALLSVCLEAFAVGHVAVTSTRLPKAPFFVDAMRQLVDFLGSVTTPLQATCCTGLLRVLVDVMESPTSPCHDGKLPARRLARIMKFYCCGCLHLDQDGLPVSPAEGRVFTAVALKYFRDVVLLVFKMGEAELAKAKALKQQRAQDIAAHAKAVESLAAAVNRESTMRARLEKLEKTLESVRVELKVRTLELQASKKELSSSKQAMHAATAEEAAQRRMLKQAAADAHAAELRSEERCRQAEDRQQAFQQQLESLQRQLDKEQALKAELSAAARQPPPPVALPADPQHASALAKQLLRRSMEVVRKSQMQMQLLLGAGAGEPSLEQLDTHIVAFAALDAYLAAYGVSTQQLTTAGKLDVSKVRDGATRQLCRAIDGDEREAFLARAKAEWVPALHGQAERALLELRALLCLNMHLVTYRTRLDGLAAPGRGGEACLSVGLMSSEADRDCCLLLDGRPVKQITSQFRSLLNKTAAAAC